MTLAARRPKDHSAKMMNMTTNFAEPDRDCDRCPRLRDFILEQHEKFPDWHNAPVPAWSAPTPDHTIELAIIGLAPGLRGANRTGRPFTGDFAGDLLYATLKEFDLATGVFAPDGPDTLELKRTAIINAVRCVPPQNKPVGAEINTCRDYLTGALARFPNLKVMVTLGTIAHQSAVRSLGGKVSAYKFGHNVEHHIDDCIILSSYHCSRYNTNTGRLTEDMFRDVFRNAAGLLNA